MLFFFPRGVLDDNLNLIESVSEGIPSYFSLIRESKQAHIDKISNKLKSDSLSAKNWWSILKTFIIPNSKSSVPPFDHNCIVYTEEEEKSHTLNNSFRDQTILPDNNSFLSDIPLYPFTSYLDSIVYFPTRGRVSLKNVSNWQSIGTGWPQQQSSQGISE